MAFLPLGLLREQGLVTPTPVRRPVNRRDSAIMCSAAAAVLAALQATTIPVNNTLINGAPVIGDGSEANPWRGVGVQP